MHVSGLRFPKFGIIPSTFFDLQHEVVRVLRCKYGKWEAGKYNTSLRSPNVLAISFDPVFLKNQY